MSRGTRLVRAALVCRKIDITYGQANRLDFNYSKYDSAQTPIPVVQQHRLFVVGSLTVSNDGESSTRLYITVHLVLTSLYIISQFPPRPTSLQHNDDLYSLQS